MSHESSALGSTMPTVDTQTLGIGIAAISAAVSAFSAYTSRQSVDRSHRPFVWPEISRKSADGREVLRVRLHNDGSGAAYDVRWSVGSVMEGRRGKIVEDARLTADNVSRVIRAFGPGEIRPQMDGWNGRSLCPKTMSGGSWFVGPIQRGCVGRSPNKGHRCCGRSLGAFGPGLGRCGAHRATGSALACHTRGQTARVAVCLASQVEGCP
jgi:hypothetical protein